MRPGEYLRSKLGLIIAVAVTVFVLVVLGLNFVSSERRLVDKLEHTHRVADLQFQREMGVLLGPGITEGNRVRSLRNGDEIFPAMLSAIDSATTSITFETYIYWSGEIGDRFARALAARAHAGVAVHVLIDWVGSQKIDAQLLESMEQAGVEVVLYRPLRWYHLSRMNNRTHRKLLVIDGHTGFTGGVGIADHWLGDAQGPDHWREMHFQVEGPVVAQMQAVFIDNWIKTTGTVLRGERYFPRLPESGDQSAQMFASSPNGGSEAMQLMYLMAIASASRSIDLSASYFVPDALTRSALVAAAGRGVRIRVVLPGEHMDMEVVRLASRAQWGELLEAGIEIHEYQPTMYHCKVLVVDGELVSVGSTNFDNRSFRLNDEANLNVFDAGLAAELTAVFERDLRHSRQVSLEAWRNRPLWERIKDRSASLFSSQL